MIGVEDLETGDGPELSRWAQSNYESLKSGNLPDGRQRDLTTEEAAETACEL